jgi:hypothetical protein
MWHVKTRVIPVKIGATGTISKSFRKYLSCLSGKHEINELQKTALLGSTHILRKAPYCKNTKYSTWEVTLHVSQIVTTEEAQH